MGSRGFRALRMVGAVFPLVLIVGCALPVPRKTNVACCPKSAPPKLDGVKPGTTRLDELPSSLIRFSTDASEGGFFWARWYKRISPIGWMGTNGDRAYIEDEFLEWKLVNVLAIFDARSVLKHYRVCSESELMECLQEVAAMAPEPPAPDSPRLVWAATREALTQWGTDRFHGKFTLAAGRASLQGTAGSIWGSGPPLDADFALTKITQMRVRYGSTRSVLHLSIHFEPDVGLDYVRIAASPSETWRLVRILRSGNSPSVSRR